jgi:hypothetical protein
LVGPAFALVMLCLFAAGLPGFADVPRFGLFERSFTAKRKHDNPYTAIDAVAVFSRPDGRTWRIGLFWDGGQTWKCRVAPETVGTWTWRVEADDPGLNGAHGEFHVTESKRSGGIRPMKGYSHHFERQNGEPFWFLGDTAWALYTDNQQEHHDRRAVEEYLDARSAQGFNVVHSMLLSEAGWGNQGGPPFFDVKAERINPGYWREVDHRLGYLNGRGMTGGLALAWGNKGRSEKYPWNAFDDLEAMRRDARYVVARYSAMDVYFIVSGEWHAEIRTTPGATEQSIFDRFNVLGETVDRADPHGRMIGIHPMTRGGSVREFAKTSWMSFGDYQQNYQELNGRILLSRNLGGPVVNSEYGYYLRDRDGDGRTDKPNSTTLEVIRHASWDVVMAGGYLVAGFGTTYFGGNRDPGPFYLKAAKNDDWEGQVQHVRKLFGSLPWWRLEPRNDLVSAPVPRGNDRRHLNCAAPPATTYWALADPGRQTVAYVRGCDRKITLSLGERAAGTCLLRQYDPRTGEFADLGRHPQARRIDYTPPDDRDWVAIASVAQKGNEP